MPGTQVVAVIALGGQTGGGAKIIEISGRAGIGAVAAGAAAGQVFMIPDRWMSNGFKCPPTESIGLVKSGKGSAIILGIA